MRETNRTRKEREPLFFSVVENTNAAEVDTKQKDIVILA